MNLRRRFAISALLVATAASLTTVGFAKDKPAGKQAKFKKPEPTRFLRVLRNKKKVPTALETAVVRYVPANGNETITVDLVGAVHVADKSYYKELNKRLGTYEVVLYELVAPKGTRIKKGERDNSTFARVVKNLLELESQIQQIDYTKKNFVHADLSPEAMAKAMEKRGETGLSVFFSVLTEMMKETNKRMQAAQKGGKPVPQISLATLLFDPDRAVKLKRYMAEEFDSANGSMALGKTLNVMLIDDRNKACIKVLDAQIKKGHKHFAIFYGAAHLPDFETRLLKEFGLKRKSTQWVRAWTLK